MDFQAVPKVELHLHLDCSLSFEVVSFLQPEITVEKFRSGFIAPAKNENLAEVLRVIDNALALMQNEKALRLVTQDLFRQLAAENVKYAEIRFAPHLHTRSGLNAEEVVRIVDEAFRDCMSETGVQAGLVLCTLRHYSEEQSLETVRLVEKFLHSNVVALDLAADEAGFSIQPHVKAFQYAVANEIPRIAHCGEARGPESIRETLDLLKPMRLSHGVRCVEDPELVEELRDRQIHLEVCPTCNIQVNVFPAYADHPINQLYEAGLSVGINTDGRTLANVSLSDEYRKLAEVFGWGKAHFARCNSDALAASFLSEHHKRRLQKHFH